MAEHDAFGRKTGDDPLEEMGWDAPPARAGETAGVEPPVEPVAEPEVAQPLEPEPAVAPADPFDADQRKLAQRRAALAALKAERARRGLNPLRWVGCLFFVVAAVIVVGAVIVLGAIGGSVDEGDVQPALVEPEDGGSTPGGPPGALDRRSMVLRGNLAPALRRLEREMGGRPRIVRIEAERVDVVAQSGNEVVAGQARWDGQPGVRSRSPGGTSAGTFAWDDINPSAPRRAVRGALRRTDRPQNAFQYLVLMDAAGLRWNVFVEGAPNGFVSADPSGRVG